jgi:membrane protein DedA with SNARE-associated domain
MRTVWDSLVDLASGSDWTYGIVLAFALLDAVAPIVPSETLVVAAAALAASGRLSLAAVLAAAAAGALLGDNVAYGVGRAAGPRLERRLSSSPARRRRLDWAARRLDERGGTLVVVSRFVPGGRTATMVAAGLLRMRWRRFVVFDVAAAVCWASYAGLIGFFGGTAFEDEPLVGVGAALGIALVLALLIEAGRRLVRRRRVRSRPT